MRTWIIRRRVLVVLGLLLLLVGIPAAVLAATGTFNGAVERQSAKWTSGSVTTSSTAWTNVPGLSLTRCTRNEVSLTISVTVSGAPVRFRGVIDSVAEAPMRPRITRFVPDGTESFSYTFVGRTASFEADDTHRFDLQWQSPTGAPVTLTRGVVNLLFERGRRGCP